MAGKVSPKTIGTKKKQELDRELVQALATIRKEKNVRLLLSLFTASEHVMLARRIQIAKRLIAGRSSIAIRRELRVGQATVDSIHAWLQQNAGDYQKAFRDLHEELRRKERQSKPIIPYSFRWMRRRYPMHFLLFNLFLDDIDWTKSPQN